MKNKNLKSFPKGITGNPKGRPKKIELNLLFERIMSEKKNGKTAAYRIIEGLFQKALRGDVRAAELLLNYAYGKPKRTVKTHTQNEVAFRIQWSDPVDLVFKLKDFNELENK